MARLRRFFQDPGGSYFLFGPRGTGKTTWLKQALKEALFLDLLEPKLHRELSARPERLSELALGHTGDTIVVDEIQKCPALLDVVHKLIEDEASKRFILTGSSSRKLKRTGVNLLAGRALRKSMHPFLATEMGADFNLDIALHQGLLPLVWDSGNQVETLDAYVALYLREEVQMEGLVRNIGSFSRFLEVASFSHGTVINVSGIARECQVSRKTVEGYLEIAEDLLLSYRVPVFQRRAKRHLSAHPKFYLFDTGVYHSLRPQGPLDRPSEIHGPALEGLVGQHLRAWIDYSTGKQRLYFWRTKSGVEVDFVIYGDGIFTAIEVKNASAVSSRDTKGLRTFLADYPEAVAYLLYRGKERLKIGPVTCLPVEAFLLALSPNGDFPA
ncbi:MAG: AAA family ATPase [Myxococcota bacterium]|nr:AAA family ATPase [Myxococcota bacterium]